MKWSPKHDRFIVDKEIRKQRKDKWLRDFDRAILLLVLTTVGVGAVVCFFVYHFSK
jgi:hypothetical protein